jgi:hypothetical protein
MLGSCTDDVERDAIGIGSGIDCDGENTLDLLSIDDAFIGVVDRHHHHITRGLLRPVL